MLDAVGVNDMRVGERSRSDKNHYIEREKSRGAPSAITRHMNYSRAFWVGVDPLDRETPIYSRPSIPISDQRRLD